MDTACATLPHMPDTVFALPGRRCCLAGASACALIAGQPPFTPLAHPRLVLIDKLAMIQMQEGGREVSKEEASRPKRSYTTGGGLESFYCLQARRNKLWSPGPNREVIRLSEPGE